MAISIPPEIFKAYDIRGIVGRTLTVPIVEQIGRAIGGASKLQLLLSNLIRDNFRAPHQEQREVRQPIRL